MSKPQRPPAPEECAQCGEPIPSQARACPGCGADERTGWRETSLYDGLDLPEGAEEDSTEASSPRSRRGGTDAGLPWYWVATLILVVLGLGLGALGLWP